MIIGALRIKNEARWIDLVLRSIQPVCDRIVILDDHSTDGTPEICEGLGAVVFRSTFEGVNETRDKDFLLSKVWEFASPGDWCLMIDGDEVLHPDDREKLRALTTQGTRGWTQRILYLWDREDQIRVDGVYGSFKRGSLFRLESGATFRRTGFGGNLHCASVPSSLVGACKDSDVRLLHLGYLHRADRIRKWNWYKTVDPNNIVEDGYRHIVQGDVPEVPATARLRHAGPLELRAL